MSFNLLGVSAWFLYLKGKKSVRMLLSLRSVCTMITKISFAVVLQEFPFGTLLSVCQGANEIINRMQPSQLNHFNT